MAANTRVEQNQALLPLCPCKGLPLVFPPQLQPTQKCHHPPEQGAGKSREMSRRSVKDWTFARGGGDLFNSSARRGCMYLAYLSTVNDY